MSAFPAPKQLLTQFPLARGKVLVGDSTGKASASSVGSAGQVLVWDGSDAAPGSVPYPPGYFENGALRAEWLTTTTVKFYPGKCRDYADSRNMVLPAAVTVDIATEGAAGLDTKTCSATATTHGTATFEPSSSILGDFITHAVTGTISSVGTAVTGTGTKFKSEFTVNDLIKSSANGVARISAIASNTALTLVAAFPGGNVTAGDVPVRIETYSVWAGSVAGEQRRINTISANGLSVVMSSAITDSGAGRTIKLGVRVQNTNGVHLIPWLLEGGSGLTLVASNQRTQPFQPTGYTSYYRRIPCGLVLNATGLVYKFTDANGGCSRYVLWDNLYEHEVFSNFSSTSITAYSLAVSAPPTAYAYMLHIEAIECVYAAGRSSVLIGIDDSTSAYAICGLFGGATAVSSSEVVLIPIKSSRISSFKLSAAITSGSYYSNSMGFLETA